MTTIIDVAQKAGVSFKTVSRVLNGEPGVRERTRKKVLDAAQLLDYKVNHSARSLRSRSPTLVGLLFDNPSRSYTHDLQLGALTGCQGAGFSLVIQSGMSNDAIDAFAKRNGLVGIIIGAPQADSLPLVQRLEAHGIPLVRIATQLPVGETHHISVNERAAARDATEHLLDLGHTNIGIINGPSNQHMATLRFQGFQDAFSDRGLMYDDRFTETGGFDFASGMQIAERYLTAEKRPTAIFAANDDMASGCLAAAYKLDIRVPDDLSVVGFDDSPIATVVYPSLTTIRQSTTEMTEMGVKLLDQIRRGQVPQTREHISPHILVQRDSTAPPPKS